MQQTKVVAGAIAFSTVIYGVVVYALAPDVSGSFDQAVRNPMVLAMYVAALGGFLAGLFVPGLMGGAPRQTRTIVAMALFESCAVFGLVAALLTKDWRLYLAPWALALIGFIRQWPREEAAPPLR